MKNEHVQGMCRVLPKENLLTETDAPYQGVDRDDFPNEPKNIPEALASMAEVRGESCDELRDQILQNYDRLFMHRAPARALFNA
mmetsp:Transcript_163780/g.520548  ORF Transcript_163780/g.520548 Transcript_163780/m.520548 type:complete len:84 (+) Transcript_163780:715-966(+)